ncbi:MAG: signal peptide peptidase SppA [Proteobacteria bacterium]|nr:signal peptide peptidase SppA [Pseudomonadota bacterium]
MSEIQKQKVNPLAVILGISAALFGFFLIFTFVYYFMKGGANSFTEGDRAHSSHGEYVGVIELKGAIMESRRILRNLKDAEEDKDIKAVVLRLNSPGGAVAPSQEIYEAVKKFPKPLVVSMASVAASGAYYIAAGSKKVYANAGTLTGSIGVIMEFMNLKKLYDWAKVERFSIKTGHFKDSGAEYRELAPDEREYFQSLVMDTLEQFKGAVAQGRKMTAEEVNAIADGRVFTGVQAKKLKLVDEIGTLDDAIKDVAKQAKIKGKPKIAYPAKKSKGLQELLLGGRHDEDDGFEEEESFVDRLVSRVADRITGVRESGAQARPAGIYVIWNGR